MALVLLDDTTFSVNPIHTKNSVNPIHTKSGLRRIIINSCVRGYTTSLVWIRFTLFFSVSQKF